MLIAEDLLLLLLDDESGSLGAASQIEVALGGAVLAELALGEAVTVGEKSGMWHTAKVSATGTPPADPVLVEAQAVIAEKERSAQNLVSRLGKGLKDRLLARLLEGGLVREEKDKAWGLFPRTRWPAVSSTHEAEVRRALEDALLRGHDPDPRTASLVALLSALGQAHKVIDGGTLSGGEVRKRATSIAEREWAAKGVAGVIAATNAAVMTAIMVSSTTAATSGGS